MSVKILWHEVWLKGPFNGICVYNSKNHYFESSKERDNYDLYILTQEEEKQVFSDYDDYCQKMGFHRDHDPNKWTPPKTEDASYTSFKTSLPLVTLRKEKQPIGTVSKSDIINWTVPRIIRE